MLKILISAYACEPEKGSEPGVGWNWAKQIAKFAEVWVITRKYNRAVIEEELKKNSEPNLHFVYVDLPKWMRFWKKRQRGVHLYYLLWQFAAYFQARRLLKEIKFDIAHHITFVNDWLPSFLAFLPIPFVWGPIGSNQPMPFKFLPHKKSKFLEFIRVTVQDIFRLFNPLFYLTLFKAKAIITIRDIKNKLPFFLLSKKKFFHQSAIGIDIDDRLSVYKYTSKHTINLISVGRLIYFKGFHLTLQAFCQAVKENNNMRLHIIGDGMDNKFLENLAHKIKSKEHIKFLGNIPRENVLKIMSESDIFLFPSFEGGGMVVLEAMACGLPIICLDYGGPGEMVTDECGIKVKPITPEQTINDLADALLKLVNDPELRRKMGEASRRRVREHYTWEKKGEFIKKIYENILGRMIVAGN
jgi:glycosyltransferase involved in cell wall biosynthesis